MSEPQATGEWPAPAGVLPTDENLVPGYEILAELGRGGMGVVYKARQLSSGQLVALKVIRDSALAGPRERTRFRIEAESAARMQHPNIVAIVEVGEHGGRPYYAMELVEGGGLDHHLAGLPQPIRETATLIRTLAHALAHAHDQKIIHRDLKPANVLLAVPASSTGEATTGQTFNSAFRIPHSAFVPKITDFGLAKRLDTESTALTHDGAVLGTPSYMSPEQAAGRVRDIGPWTDVYALGATLYELLTGSPPFQAESWEQAIQQVLHDDPAPPSRSRPDTPRDLEAICLKCLEKDCTKRYTHGGELAEDLTRFLDGQAIAAVPIGSAERLARLARREGYSIVGEIGRGPRSTVYHARYDPLDQPVALKVFPQGSFTRDEWDARLRRGAGLGAVIAHPHVVPVRQAGWWDEAPYVIAEYVPHGSLAARLVGKPHSLRDTLRMVAQLAELVGYFHRQGVVHGNLKPSNVLLAADGIPRVADFRPTGGLYLGKLPAGDENPVGLDYVAPEYIRNPDAEPRPFTDVYGLGVILYEMLTGRPPFIGDTAEGLAAQILSLDPVPPTQLNPEVIPDLERVCLHCLRKNPWRRFPRAYDIVSHIRRIQDDLDGRGIPTPRRPPTRGEPR